MGEISTFRAAFCHFGALEPKRKEYTPKLKPQNFYLFIHLYVCRCVCTVYILLQIYVYTHLYIYIYIYTSLMKKEVVGIFLTCLEILIVHWSCFLSDTNLLWKTGFCTYSFCVTGPALPCLSSIWERCWENLVFPWEKFAPAAGLHVAVMWENAGSSATTE